MGDMPVLIGAEFPPSFLFGASTSSYQIEGAADADGKGESIWDRFCMRRGTIDRGESGSVACNHYRLWREDVDLMRRLGLEAYRFSISWPRIQPEGRGGINERGIEFYDSLVDELLEVGVEPFLTLYHWDLPQALQDEGGWAQRETALLFADYAATVARAIGDRVKYFITLNEPWMFAFVGNLLGQHAPGKHNPWLAMKVLHNALIGHAEAVAAVKAERPSAQVGISLSLSPVEPSTESKRDKIAAYKADLLMNRLLLDPVLRGAYPDEARKALGVFFPRIRREDEALLAATKIDFLGINTYTREKARYTRRVPFFHFWTDAGDVPDAEFERDGAQYTSMGSEVYPNSLRTVLERLRDEYGNPPVYVTENGAAFSDEAVGDGVHDPKRTAFIGGYLAAAAKAIEGGCDLRGYFYWSLFDNFEWSYGYTKRMGLVYVDFETQRRIIKDSGKRYADIVAQHRYLRRDIPGSTVTREAEASIRGRKKE